MRLLADMELAVGEVAQILGQSQPRVSRHIGILCDAGLAERRREGSWTFLRQTISERSPHPLAAAVAQLLAAGEACDPSFAERCAEDRRHLAAIRANRENAAAEYFAERADEWDRVRAMLGPAEKVESALVAALADAPIGRLLDVGTGTGRIAELLTRFDLADVADERPESLPLGIRQRLQLAVAVLHKPAMLILDEPTSGVDPIARDAFWRTLIDLSRDDGVTIFLSTHFMNEAERCDRISFMHAGKVLAVGVSAVMGGDYTSFTEVNVDFYKPIIEARKATIGG